jgi:hypothetical protein
VVGQQIICLARIQVIQLVSNQMSQEQDVFCLLARVHSVMVITLNEFGIMFLSNKINLVYVTKMAGKLHKSTKNMN